VLVTLWMSLIPADQVPSPLHLRDKVQHTVSFAGLAAASLLAYPGQSWGAISGLALFGALASSLQSHNLAR